MQLAAAHPLDERDGQERMAAELEEVVAAADAADLQQLAPDLGQRGLDLALRRFIGARGERIAFRRRQ